MEAGDSQHPNMVFKDDQQPSSSESEETDPDRKDKRCERRRAGEERSGGVEGVKVERNEEEDKRGKKRKLQ